MLHIAIDGPAGAGKSTIAKAVAKELAIPYLDTGAMYRTLALHAIRQGVNPADAEGVARVLPGADVRATFEAGMQHMLLNGEDVTGLIRTQEVSDGASAIGVHPPVRDALVALQQAFARDSSVVMDGRDIGTVVLPQARFKFFLTASPSERALRRKRQDEAKGLPVRPIAELEREIRERDYRDSHREYNPLRQAENALLIDTTHMTEAESIGAVLSAIRNSLH